MERIEQARQALTEAREALRTDNMFTLSVKIDAALSALEASGQGEASYQAYRKAVREEFADEPADLAGTLRMLDKWTPEAMPANEVGQVSFARALLDSTAEAIRKHLSALEAEGGTGWRLMDSAPTDGTKFDAWCVRPEGRGEGVRFTDVQMRGDGSGFGVVVHNRSGVEWDYIERNDIFPAWKLVAWMPRPTPPAQGGNHAE